MRGFFIAIVLILLLGGVAGAAYEAGLAAGAAAIGAAGTAVAASPYWHAFGFGSAFLGLLFPLLFIFLIFGMIGAAFRGARGYGYGKHWGGPRMFDEWHKEAHERGGGGKAES